jgi:4-amino-4-deoxy-L-arabinose transferase-like glycosyltransferase
MRLPAVDRTEIIYAETTRDMVARGDWTDPRYGAAAHQYRPIGTFWAQGASRWLAGDALARDIRVYRVASLVAVTLAALALFWLGSAIVGAEAALIASALFAVAPLTVLVSQLAIAEGLSLLPATVAMLALARIYTSANEDRSASPPSPRSSRGEGQGEGRPQKPVPTAAPHPSLLPARGEREWFLPLLFWAALGLGVLINALLVPILVLATLIALFVMDRDLSWLKRLRPLVGIPVALLIAAPWLIVRAHQDGVAFSGMSWREFLGALGGAQDMKLRALPGTFVLALVLGFLPGTALIGSAFARLWNGRDQRLLRFLLAWVIGYLVYLEALSSKPGTYMVQTMFPALALAVASVVVAENGHGKPPKWHAFPSWPTSLAALPLAIFAAVYVFAGEWPSLIPALAILLIVALFIWSGRQGREGGLRRWAATGVAALGLFAITLLGGVLPSIGKMWPAEQLRQAIAACPASKMDLVGFREPSGRFILGVPPAQQTLDGLAAGIKDNTPRFSIIEDRWLTRANAALDAKSQGPLPPPSGCVSAYNVMRGCPLHFRIFETGAARPCALPANLACSGNPEPSGPQKSGDCD